MSSLIVPSVTYEYVKENTAKKSLHICPHINVIKNYASNAMTLNDASEISFHLFRSHFFGKINQEVKREKKNN